MESPTEVAVALDKTGYLPDDGIATAAFLAMRMRRPLLCEGEPGTGKTALAQALLTLGQHDLDTEVAASTLGAVLKYREDTERVRSAGVAAGLAGGDR